MFSVFSIDGGVVAPQGFYCDGVSAGLKKDNGLDVAFIYADSLCEVEGIFTKNKFCAAPILHFKSYPKDFKTNFVLVNSKNANALTGDEGLESVKEVLGGLQYRFSGIQNPIMSSTGVIGVQLPKVKIIESFNKFDLSQKNHNNAAEAIMTTDSFSKTIAFEVVLEDKRSFRIGAMCKGAGMINPSLATMLCFITTDASIPKRDMQELLLKAADSTFNAISVDGDTSTNDTVLLLSNGKSGVYDKEAFLFTLEKVMHKLATDIVRDGEGATKLVAFEVKGAKNKEEAKRGAKALSQSLLVKTALFGCDPNWGRIASTIGASGITCNPKTLEIYFGDVCVYQKGVIYFNEEYEQKAAEILKQDSFKITCVLGVGEGAFVAYGCDLGYEYVKINADYRS
ncbi:bifunctional glutamate N-acetyltransferase/amino-acid acetyltransferase ArgJ [Helicobacter turcicus]|uniref:Arginine biosynthesis bifunctional protein ArgJ n=1 Tax=Helicobacter turcicus TaxID=2867412 RepID=A0ABS7JL74_9HELI|nr:bifunctional glutamate N-acetyltransferase/amino-acid acetyltransferase ArgJ [Helicobacter turcicus]MBX7490155.1 bifunctional glutamate N-acetyltransferase/amino-acid acetyltransferase ArgJ [Helicobacter turcicus]MBX7545013.1 bifunctional glutamate N-acetyltransferase/amino-acid acetyltransferase ArgJ [Helicobacter turcicus]